MVKWDPGTKRNVLLWRICEWNMTIVTLKYDNRSLESANKAKVCFWEGWIIRWHSHKTKNVKFPCRENMYLHFSAWKTFLPSAGRPTCTSYSRSCSWDNNLPHRYLTTHLVFCLYVLGTFLIFFSKKFRLFF